MKRTRLRRVGRKRASVAQLDALCRAVVFKRDGDKCARCGKTERLQWCHVYSRRYHSMRWDPDNSFVGCAGCHLWWHHRPADAIEWWKVWAGPAIHMRLMLSAATPHKIDKEAIRLDLQARLR